MAERATLFSFLKKKLQVAVAKRLGMYLLITIDTENDQPNTTKYLISFKVFSLLFTKKILTIQIKSIKPIRQQNCKQRQHFIASLRKFHTSQVRKKNIFKVEENNPSGDFRIKQRIIVDCLVIRRTEFEIVNANKLTNSH